MRIALTEDNEALASAIADRLPNRGHSVDVVHDGREADVYLSQEGADQVALDINLPGMSGWTSCAASVPGAMAPR